MKKTIIAVCAVAVICLLTRLFVLHTVRIEGTSMNNTLCDGDIVLVTDLDYAFDGAPDRGDIVECTFPNRSGKYIKRVIGLPEEHIAIREGCLYINGTPMAESYVSSVAEDYEIQLGPGEYLVLGDNRKESYDSRAEDMGVLNRDNFTGRVRFGLYPFHSIK